MAKIEYETKTAKEIRFGKNSFIEIARKIARSENGENEFVSISKGFYLPDGSKRFKRGMSLPRERELLVQIAEVLTNI